MAPNNVVRTGILLEAKASGLKTITNFKNQLKSVNTQAKVTSGALATFSGVTKLIGATIGRLAGPLALGGLAVGFAKASASAIKYGDELDKASQRTSVNADTLDRWYRSANLADVSQERINKSLTRLSVNLKNATDQTDSLIINNQRVQLNSSAVADAFRTLGISVVDSTGHLKTNDVVMREVADSVQRLGVNSETTSAVFKIFGQRGGQELLPFLKQGSEGVDRFSSRLGQKFATDAALFDDNMVLLGARMKTFTLQLTAQMLPTLIRFQNWLLNSQKIFDPFLKAILNANSKLQLFLDPIIKKGIKIFQDLGKIIKNELVAQIDSARDKWNNWKPRINEVIVIVTSLVNQIRSDLREAIENARLSWNDWKPRINEVIVIVESLIDKVKSELQQAIEFARNSWNSWKPQIEIVTSQVLVLVDKIRNDLNDGIQFARDKWLSWKPAIDPIINQISNILTPLIKNDLALAIDFVSGTWTQLKNNVSGLSNIIKNELVPAILNDISLGIKFVSGTWDLFVENVKGLDKLIENVIIPSIKKDIPIAIDFLSGTWEQFNNNVEGLSTLIKNIIIPGIKNDISLAIQFAQDTWDNFNSIVIDSGKIYSSISNTLENTFTNSISTIRKEWNKIINSIEGTIDDLGRALQDIPDRALEGWKNLATEIRRTVGKAIEDITKPLREIGNFLGIGNGGGNLFNRNNSGSNKGPLSGLGIPGFASGGIVTRPTLATIGEEGAEAIIPLSQLGRGIGGNLGGSGGGLIAGLRDALNYIKEIRINTEVLKKDIGEIGKGFSNAFSGVSNVIGNVLGGILNLATGVGILSSAFRIGLFAVFIRFNKQLVPLFAKAIDITLLSITKLVQGFNVASDFIENLPIHLSNARTRFIEFASTLNTIPRIAQTVANVIGGLAQGLGTSFISGVNAAINGIQQLWLALGNDSRNVINAAITNISQFNQVIGRSFVSSIQFGINAIRNLGIALISGLGNTVKIGINSINSIASVISNHLPSGINTGISAIKNLGIALVTGLGNNIKLGISNISQFAQSLVSKLGQGINIAIQSIGSFGNSITSSLGSKIQEGIKNLNIFRINVGTLLRSALKSTTNYISSDTIPIFDKLTEGVGVVRTAFNKLKNLLSGAFSAIFDKVIDSVQALDDILNTQFAQNIRNTLQVFGLAKDENELFGDGLNQVAMILTQAYNPAISDLKDRFIKANIEIDKANQSTQDYIKTNQLASGEIKSKVIPTQKENNKTLQENTKLVIDLTKKQNDYNNSTQGVVTANNNVKTSLDSVQTELKNTGKEAQINTNSISTGFNKVETGFSKIATSIQTKLGNINKSFRQTKQESLESAKAIDKNKNILITSEPPIRKATQALKNLLSKGFRPLNNVLPKVNNNLSQTEKRLRKIPPAGKSAGNSFKGLGNSMKSILSTSGNLLKTIGKLIATVPGLNLLVGGFLAFRVVTSITNRFKNLLRATSQLNRKLAELRGETNISASTLYKFATSARNVGLEISDASSLIESWNDSIIDLTSNKEEIVNVFDSLGIAVRDVSGEFRSSEDILFDYAQIVSSSNDEVSKAILNNELFGESGAKVNKILVDLSSQGKTYNTSIERSTDLQDQLRDRTSKVSAAFETFGNVIYNTFAPAIIDLIDLAGKASNALKDLFGVERELTNIEIFKRLNKITSEYFDRQEDLRLAEERADNAAINRAKGKIRSLEAESRLLKSQLKFLSDTENKYRDIGGAASDLKDEIDSTSSATQNLTKTTKEELDKTLDAQRLYSISLNRVVRDHFDILSDEREKLEIKIGDAIIDLSSDRIGPLTEHINLVGAYRISKEKEIADKILERDAQDAETRRKRRAEELTLFAEAEKLSMMGLREFRQQQDRDANLAALELQKERTESLREGFKNAIVGLLDGTKSWNDLLNDIWKNTLNRIYNKIAGNIADSILNGFTQVTDSANNGFTGIVNNLFTGFGGLFKWLLSSFTSIFQGVGNLISGIFGGIGGGGFGGIGKGLAGIGNKITSALGIGGGVAGGGLAVGNLGIGSGYIGGKSILTGGAGKVASGIGGAAGGGATGLLGVLGPAGAFIGGLSLLVGNPFKGNRKPHLLDDQRADRQEGELIGSAKIVREILGLGKGDSARGRFGTGRVLSENVDNNRLGPNDEALLRGGQLAEARKRLVDRLAEVSKRIGGLGLSEGNKDTRKRLKAEAVSLRRQIGTLNSVRGNLAGFRDFIPLQFGGIVPATPGGQLSLIGEGRFNEAVVPLPNGRSIPIELPKNYDRPNTNITFTVNIDNNVVTESTTTTDSTNNYDNLKQQFTDFILEQQQPGGALYSS